MTQSNGHKSAAKTAVLKEELPVEAASKEEAPAPKASAPEAKDGAKEPAPNAKSAASIDLSSLEDTFGALKTLLSSVEKLQKSRQEVGDIKPQLVRRLDGELLADEEVEQLKTGVNGLSKLVRFYSEYQIALEKAQPARELLDEVIK